MGIARTLIVIALAACVLFLVLATLAVDAEPLPGTPGSCDNRPAAFHTKRARAIIREAYSTDRYLDATPATRSEKQRWREHRLCIRVAKVRRQISEYVDKQKRAFAAYFSALLYPPGEAKLRARRLCESGGDYSTNTGNGYYGAYQFDLQSWAGAGGSGYPNLAPAREQDYRAARWDQITSGDPWPNCP